MAKYTEDENGFLTFPDTPLSSAGVFPYAGSELPQGLGLDPNKIYNVYRPESELNNAETIESFKLSPWFPRHEMTGEGFTAAEDIGVQGTTGQDVRYVDGVGLVATVKTFGNKLKDAIRNGLRELSCGFRCQYEAVSGMTPDGVSYDVVQRNIRGNHLASVDEGRMGSRYSVAMDAVSIKLDDVKQNEESSMSLEEIMKALAEANLSDDEKKALKDHVDEMIGGVEANREERVERAEDEEDPSKAEDEEIEVVAEDEDSPKDDTAMGALMKEIKQLRGEVTALKGAAMDAKQVEQMINEKNQLLNELEPVLGKIDGSGLDANGVAKKAADIIGIACDSKSALASVRGFLHGRKNIKTTVDRGTAQDQAAKGSLNKQLDEMGI